ncbi:MAG TPA: DUF2330 domain-containing protein [Acidimicrobiales bacterium]|nr:DUF2330 domain-containing protein [Acidimicrobiales bacterium]
MRRNLSLLVPLLAGGLLFASAAPAGACGGLVAPNGAVRLNRTTTLAAYHAGVEHYVTSFQYAGGSANFGSIIPLPGVPSDVSRAGSWTLQRLEQEVHPLPLGALAVATASASPGSATVLFQTTVDALDITVLKGGGADVLQWIKDHGYFISDDAPAMLDFYAQRSPIFLAARFDASRAAALQQQAGDGTPIQITIPTPNPWVPLHILTLAKIPAAPIQADVFLLTDHSPALLGLDPGVNVTAGEPATARLLSDLRSDKNSSWVPDSAWLTYITINSTAAQVRHDLAIDTTGASHPSAVQAGFFTAATAPQPRVVALDPISDPVAPATPWAWAFAGLFAVALVVILAWWTVANRTRRT